MDLARYLCSPPEAAGRRARAAHFSRPSKSFYLYSTFSRSRSSKSNVVSRRACLSSAAVDKHLILHLATAFGSSTFTSLLPKINKFQFSSFIYLELNTLTRTGCSSDWSLYCGIGFVSKDCEWSALSSLGQMLRLTRRAKIAYRTKRLNFVVYARNRIEQATPHHATPLHSTPLVKTIQANHLQQPKKTCLHALNAPRVDRVCFFLFSPSWN